MNYQKKSIGVILISTPYVAEISEIIERYIREKEIGEDIFIPLSKLAEEIDILNTYAFNILDEEYLKKSKNNDISNFLFYHGVRNLKIATLKIIESFKQAKIKMLNPKVAKNMKIFIEPFIKFLFFLKVAKESELISVEDLSEEVERFRESAKQASFLCTTDEELRYDKIPHKKFRELIKSIKEF